MDKSTEAKAQLIQARKPFDTALSAIEQITENRDFVISILLEVFKTMNPNRKDLNHIKFLLKSGEFPEVWEVDGNLRINGELEKKDSLIDFIKKNS